MSEEAKRRSAGGAPIVKSPSDDLKLSSGSTATTVDGKKYTIKSADMKDEVQKEAIEIAISAFEKHNVEKDVAEYIKKEFDKKYGPTWHCIVGKNFGTSKYMVVLFGIAFFGCSLFFWICFFLCWR